MAAGKWLGFIDTVYQWTEIFSFAARLAMTPAGDEEMHLSVSFGLMNGRTLRMEDFNRWIASIERFPYELSIARVQLLARPRELAVAAAQEMFRRVWLRSRRASPVRHPERTAADVAQARPPTRGPGARKSPATRLVRSRATLNR